MSIIELFILAVGLSMDTFAVAVCKGLSLRKLNFKSCLTVGLWFGAFQALMPTVGYLLGSQFRESITAFDHWIAFILLGIIGANMIKEALSKDDDDNDSGSDLSVKAMLPLAIATSIDALAVGITFAFLQVHIVAAVSFIGTITFTISAVGVKIGNAFGAKYKSRAEILGGIILIVLGIKILIEHLIG